MATAMIRYRVKRERLDEHLELLRAVYAELEATQPEGLRYATFQLDDEVSFVDVATAPDLPGPLPNLASFQRYRAALEERCEERVYSEPAEVGSFRFHP